MKNLVTTIAMLGLITPSLFAQNTPPTLTCPESSTVDCAPTNGAPVTLTATVLDAETNAVTVVWFVDGTAYQTNDLAAGTTAPAAALVTFSGMFAIGEHEVVVSASDGGPAVSCTNTLEIVADAPPVITNITANPRVLWPPNHKMRRIQLNVQATDDCGAVTSRVVSVASNEPERGPGSGNHAPDWIIGQDGQSLALRAERSGRNKNGRIYTVTIATTDTGGNTTNGTVTVIVPHDNRRMPPPAAKPEKPTPPGKAKEKNKGKKK